MNVHGRPQSGGHSWRGGDVPDVDTAISMVRNHSTYRTRSLLRMAFARAGWHYTTASRCAARYAHLQGCTFVEAGAVFGVSSSSVCHASKSIYR